MQPDTELPIFPDEFECTVYGTEMSSSITTKAVARLPTRMRVRMCLG